MSCLGHLSPEGVAGKSTKHWITQTREEITVSKKYEKPFLQPFSFDGPLIGHGASNCKPTGSAATLRCDVGTQATGTFGCQAGNQAPAACNPTGTSVGS